MILKFNIVQASCVDFLNFDIFFREKMLDSPTDSGRLVFIIFYYIGFSILFPYMMLLTITDFWNYKVCMVLLL